MSDDDGDMRGHADCPGCGQRVIDITFAEMRKFGGPEDFMAAATTLMRAHLDTCTPVAPELPDRMRRARRAWRWRNGIAFAAIGGVTAFYLATSPNWLEHMYVLPIVAGYALSVYATQHEVYRAGYLRGLYAGRHHQKPVHVRYLHAADGVKDPSDN